MNRAQAHIVYTNNNLIVFEKGSIQQFKSFFFIE